jgi:subtilisin
MCIKCHAAYSDSGRKQKQVITLLIVIILLATAAVLTSAENLVASTQGSEPNVPTSLSDSVASANFTYLPMLSGTTPVQSAGYPPSKVKVLITFSSPPGPAEEALVRSMGGDIKYRYSLVAAIASSVPEAAVAALRRAPTVTLIEPDIEVHLMDAELDSVWGVQSIGAAIVHAQGNQGAGVKIGIFDTGIDLDHPDLRYDPACSTSFVIGETLDDGHSHGTHVAGTIAALDNDIGVVGVAPASTLCIYKVFSNAGAANYSDIIAALDRAVTDGVQITNHSYGSLSDPGELVKAAFDNTYAAGVLHVAAAGNYGTLSGTGENCIYPARWATVLATAAINQSSTRINYSSTCSEVELTAPGDVIYSTIPGGAYGDKSGTSMAAPHVAGSAALIWAANPHWSHEQVRAKLQSTANDLGVVGLDPWYGFGLVDAFEAARTEPVNTLPVANSQAVTTVEDTPVAILLTASDVDGDTLTYSVVSGPAMGTLSGTAPHLTYSPHPGFRGDDTFTFLTSDGFADGNMATVSITVIPPVDKVAILKASYTAARKSLTIEATSSAGNNVTLVATAYDSAGHLLGSIKMDYTAKKARYIATLTGLPGKPYRVQVTSSNGGSASMVGAAIGGKG